MIYLREKNEKIEYCIVILQQICRTLVKILLSVVYYDLSLKLLKYHWTIHCVIYSKKICSARIDEKEREK